MSGQSWSKKCGICGNTFGGVGLKGTDCPTCPKPSDEMFPLSPQAQGMAPQGYISAKWTDGNNPYIDPRMIDYIRQAQQMNPNQSNNNQAPQNQPNGQPLPSQGNGLIDQQQIAALQARLLGNQQQTPQAQQQQQMNQNAQPQMPPFYQMPNYQLPQRAQQQQPMSNIEELLMMEKICSCLERIAIANERVADGMEAMALTIVSSKEKEKLPMIKQSMSMFTNVLSRKPNDNHINGIQE